MRLDPKTFLTIIIIATCAAQGAFATGVSGPENLRPDPPRYVAPDLDFDVIHTHLDLDLDLKAQTIAGAVTHTLSPLKPGLHTIRLNCVDLDVDEVLVNEVPVDFEYPVMGAQSTSWIEVADERGSSTQLVVQLDHAFGLQEPLELKVRYHGAPKMGLYFIAPEKGVPEKRYEVWSQGEGEDNRYWIPCFDYPNDKATYEGVFRVDKNYYCVSNGILIEKKEIGNKVQYHWGLDTPQASYLIMVAAGEYEVIEDSWRNVSLLYLAPPGTSREKVMRGYGLTPDMMEFFSNYIGIDYPYHKYAQIIVQNFIYGGMENTTATIMNERSLYDEHLEVTRTSQGLVAHELAHQWWGDMTTCVEWSHIWLNEGFATYFQSLYRQHHDGDDAFRYEISVRHDSVVARDDRGARPMVVDFFNRSGSRNSSLVYIKGSSILHMLRSIIGDELFRRCMQTYGERHKFGPVETSDLSQVVKQTTGENLDWFFEQWAYLAGHPKLKVTKTWDEDTGTLKLHIAQTQKVGGLIPLFRLPMNVDIMSDGKTETHRIVVDQASQQFYFKLPAKPKMVVVDDGDWILKTLDFPKSTGEFLFQLEHGTTMARVRALRALGDQGRGQDVIEAIAAVLENDGFWGVRREAALALGAIGSTAAEEALLQGTRVPEARVRYACAEAIAKLEPSKATDEGLLSLLHGDFADEVRSRAVKSLVAMESKRAEKACIEALSIQSNRDFVRNAGLNGLAELEATDAIGKVKALTGKGNRRTYRHDAIRAYAKLASKLKRENDRERAATNLEEMLDDWHRRTRQTVIGALKTLGEKHSVTALEKAAASDPVQSLRDRAKRAARRIESQHADIAEAGALRDDIKELTEKIESLRKDLEKLQANVAGSGENSDALSRKDTRHDEQRQ